MQDVEVVIRAGSDLFPSYSISGQSLKVVDMARKIIDLLEKTKRERESFGVGMLMYSLAHGYCGWAMAFLGRFEEGEAFFEKGLRFAMTNDKLGLGWVEFTYGWHLNIKGQAEDAIEHLRKAVIILEDAKVYTVLPLVLYQLGWAHLLTGESVVWCHGRSRPTMDCPLLNRFAPAALEMFWWVFASLDPPYGCCPLPAACCPLVSLNCTSADMA